jgi:hypothetical protein
MAALTVPQLELLEARRKANNAAVPPCTVRPDFRRNVFN